MLSCKHVFCFNCIKDWSQVTNLCPLCKSEFLDIRKKIGFSNEILETIKVERKKLKIEENLEEIEDDCKIKKNYIKYFIFFKKPINFVMYVKMIMMHIYYYCVINAIIFVVILIV